MSFPTLTAPESVTTPTADQTLDDGVEGGAWGVVFGWLDRLGEAPAWLVSAGVHLLILFLLAGITQVTIVHTQPDIISEIEEPQLDQYKFEEATVVDQVGNDSNLDIASPSQAAATEAGKEPVEQIEQRLISEVMVKLPTAEFIPPPNQMDLTSTFDAMGANEHPGGVEGAVNLLTQEIASSLRENETTVIWMFDASLSLKERRNKIADRFSNIYAQLGQLDVVQQKGTDQPLLTIAATYGEKWNLLTPEPVADVHPLAEKIRNIPADESGVENVFTAIDDVTGKFMNQRTRHRRNVLVFVVTDERGDDYQNLETIITKLKRYGVRVFCVGNAAPLGRQQAYFTWRYEDGAVDFIPVDQGPETVAPDLLTLPFWGRGEPEIMSSGFGPYAMTRLCAETGGLYLVTEESMQHRFDPAIMRKYAPDYRPIAVYEAELKKNLAKAALVGAATISQQENHKNAIPLPRLVFPVVSDAELNRSLGEAQKPMAVVEAELNPYLTLLEAGSKQRDRLDSPRWKASFDLAVGRVLALKARSLGYNQTLGDMKVTPKAFEKKNSNQWRVIPSDTINSGPVVKKLAEAARESLARVVDEHPGTPWAELAARELATPLGWAWVEQNDLVARFGPKAADPEVAQLLLAEEEKKKSMMKPMPAGPKHERPKL